MSLVLTEEQEMLGTEVRRILKDVGAVSHLRELRESPSPAGFSHALWRAFCDAGFSAILIPEKYGGAGLGMPEVGVVMQEIGRTLVPIPFLATSVLSVTALNRAASKAQKADLLPRIISGDVVVALALEEQAKHRPESLSLRSTPAGGGFALNGAKTFVLDGQAADYFIVVTRPDSGTEDESSVSLFLVSRELAGISVERTAQIDGHMSAKILFQDCRVEQNAVMGVYGEGRDILEHVVRCGRLAVAGELLGVAEECLLRTVVYLKTRKQFGRLIGEFQALQHRAARLFVEVEMSRAAVLAALEAYQTSSARAELLASVAKARAGATASLVVQESVQLHGGIGMTDELDIGLFLKRARVLQEAFGDVHYHLNRIAELGGY